MAGRNHERRTFFNFRREAGSSPAPSPTRCEGTTAGLGSQGPWSSSSPTFFPWEEKIQSTLSTLPQVAAQSVLFFEGPKGLRKKGKYVYYSKIRLATIRRNLSIIEYHYSTFREVEYRIIFFRMAALVITSFFKKLLVIIIAI